MSEALDSPLLERLLQRDRAIGAIALVAASALAWSYLLFGAGMDGQSMPMPDMAMPAHWTASYFLLILLMWSVMMIAMMLPSAAPVILLFAAVERRRGRPSPVIDSAKFVAVYLLVWCSFSLVATVLQWQLDRLALLSETLAATSSLIAALVLLAAGVYQFSPLKQACLRRCRSPLELIVAHWGRGPAAIGLRHALYCLGCCWALMLLLFVGGVMNLAWVAAIAALVLAEKLLPRGEWLSHLTGAVLIGWGGWVLWARFG